jgi:hypothetical protein
MALNVGDAAEGAFAISLALFVIENDQIKGNSRLKHSKENVKYWMKQIDPSLFQNGGVWTKTLYSGYATLAKSVNKVPTTERRVTPRTSNQIPYDIAEITVSVSLKPESVREAFGKDFDNTTLDGIITQMVTNSGRYKSIINDYKKRFMTNHRSEYFSINISTIGKEGEQSGGAIKGDIQMDMTIQPVDIVTRKPIGSAHKRRFPMYFSLKASNIPPKTISNESPITSLSKLSAAFGVNVLESTQENVLLERLPITVPFFTTANKKKQRWEIDLFGNGLGRKTNSNKFIVIGGDEYSTKGIRIYDLLDPSKFPALSRATTSSDKVWKSYVVARYVDSVFNLLPSGQLNRQQSELIWNYLFVSAFGLGDYASNTMLLAFGSKTYQGSSLEYVQKVQEASGNQIFCVKGSGKVVFYVGNSAKPDALLFHIRYKNRTSYKGDIGENARFNLDDVVKLELKLMPETGPAFKEKPNWTPKKNLNFDPDTGKILIEK